MHPSRLRSLSLMLLFGLGLYAPTSRAGTFSPALWAASFVVLALLLLPLLFRKNGISSLYLFANSVILIAVLLAATILSPFPDYRWGGLLGYLLLALLLTVNLKDVALARPGRVLFVLASGLNLCAGFAVLLGDEAVSGFLVNYYSNFYPELVEFMTTVNKPVLFFGTHSIAAFFFYLFFLLNYYTFKLTKRRLCLVLSLCYIVLGYSLLSLTALVLMSLALFQVLRDAARGKPELVAACLAVVCLAAPLSLRHYLPEAEDWEAAGTLVTSVFASESNGFLGRFSESGTMFSTVRYVQERPFSPVGAGYRSDLFFGDSGPVEYYLRGSVFLIAAVYGGLFFFLRGNLLSKADAHLLFAVIVAFELGYTSLTHLRILYLLPFIVVYLNDLRRRSGSC